MLIEEYQRPNLTVWQSRVRPVGRHFLRRDSGLVQLVGQSSLRLSGRTGRGSVFRSWADSPDAKTSPQRVGGCGRLADFWLKDDG